MTRKKSPASGKRKGLETMINRPNFIMIPQGSQRNEVLMQIAAKWVERECYGTVDRALLALIGGVI